MNTLLAWFAAARWRLSLSHCFEGLLIQIPIGLLFDFRIGALAVVVWYWSRKKLEVELKVLQSDESHAYSWAVGWFPWQWDAYKVLDVIFPAASSIAIAVLLSPCRGLAAMLFHRTL